LNTEHLNSKKSENICHNGLPGSKGHVKHGLGNVGMKMSITGSAPSSTTSVSDALSTAGLDFTSATFALAEQHWLIPLEELRRLWWARDNLKLGLRGVLSCWVYRDLD
jgi:hypothetical protein